MENSPLQWQLTEAIRSDTSRPIIPTTRKTRQAGEVQLRNRLLNTPFGVRAVAEHELVWLARKQIEFSRSYTLTLLGDVAEEEWLIQPTGGVTHLAWQVGHLAMAQYMLTLFRLRGKLPEDESLIPKAFLKRFVKGSTPEGDPSKYPRAGEILDVFHRVYARLIEELPEYGDADLDGKVVEPYAVFDTKLGSLFFCASHEMLHAGQIGLIRRLLGKPPVR
ncbi:MAG: DinB family protein [Pirellulales bacterium]|nr:DinB family protein [Pirellulales bacterium]